jgi:hypothetical protein
MYKKSLFAHFKIPLIEMRLWIILYSFEE